MSSDSFKHVCACRSWLRHSLTILNCAGKERQVKDSKVLLFFSVSRYFASSLQGLENEWDSLSEKYQR